MNVNSNVNPTIAFFGSTGGCVNACLVHSLRAGYHAVALVRTPSKLEKQLRAQGISQEVISCQLTIIEGNALDVTDVKCALTADGSIDLVTTIISGIGPAPKVQFSIWRPLQIFTLDNPTVCATATKALFNALQELYVANPSLASTKPLVAAIATTGITRGPEDVPLLMRFLYHRILAVPHADKKNMEEMYRNNMAELDENKRLFRSFTGIRPTLLTGGLSVNDAAGLSKVRTGTEPNPATGYTIRRADVGHWIFENIVNPKGGSSWEGQMVTLTS